MTAKKRIAIVGADERVERLDWPEHLDIRHYPYKSPNAIRRLQQSAASGSLDQIIVLTSYVGHGTEGAVHGMGVPVARFDRSPAQLCRTIGSMFPPPEPSPPNPLEVPSRPEEYAGPGRGPLPVRMSSVRVDDTLVQSPPPVPEPTPEVPSSSEPMFERDGGGEPPRPDETLAEALRRLSAHAGFSQADLCRLLGKPQPTVNAWFMGRSRPSDMGPLVDLWPELARFEPGRPASRRRQEAPAPKAAEEWEEVPRREPEAAPIVPEPSELERAVLRWVRARKELQAAEAELERLGLEVER